MFLLLLLVFSSESSNLSITICSFFSNSSLDSCYNCFLIILLSYSLKLYLNCTVFLILKLFLRFISFFLSFISLYLFLISSYLVFDFLSFISSLLLLQSLLLFLLLLCFFKEHFSLLLLRFLDPFILSILFLLGCCLSSGKILLCNNILGI